MATAVVELRRLRTAGINDPERVVGLGEDIIGKAGLAAAGDECITVTSKAL
jgi:hypothetical protein